MRVNRRSFGLGLGATVSALALARGAWAASDVTIVVNGSGGSLADAIKRIFEDPFTAETGIKVQATAPVSLPKLKAMVESGNVEWDLTELNGDDVVTAEREGWLEPLDYSIIDPDNEMPAMAKKDYAFVRASYSTVLAYRTDRYPEPPQSWADFWDIEKFPGPRGLQNSPRCNLEFALLADGVPLDQLYPLDVERAFAKLDEIKPHITVWWENGAQHVQILIDGEVNMTTCWNGRITPLKAEGKPVDITWNGGGLLLSYLGIPKGAKHPKEAMQFIRYRNDPVASAEFLKVMPYPGFNPKMMEMLDAEMVATLPTAPDNAAVQYAVDDQWWAENNEAITQRWNEWLLI